MKRYLFYFIFVTVFLNCKNENLPLDVLKDFSSEKVIGKWVNMWNSYDLSMVDTLFVADETVTYFSSEREGLISGIDSLRKHHSGFGFVPGGKKQENRLYVEDINVSLFGNTPILTGIWYFEKPGQKVEEIQKGPFTAVYVKKEGRYRIAHMHFANYIKE
ncbi:hypothetical protein ACFL4T_07020 [candidate division KSB1 bacterium]